jgi:hypothetical protein
MKKKSKMGCFLYLEWKKLQRENKMYHTQSLVGKCEKIALCRIINQSLTVEDCYRLCNATIGVSILLYILQESFEVSGQCFPALSCNIS